MSSTQAALILSRASRRALWSLRFSRSSHSVSTRRESRSSKLSAPSRGSLCCSLQARAKASSRRALSFSMVGSVSMGVLPLGGSVVVVLAADVLVAKRWVGGRGRCFRQGGAVQAVPEDRLDASVGAGANGEGPGAGALQALWAVAAGGAWPGGWLRGWEATRAPRWKSSTVVAVTRASTCSRRRG